MREWTEGVKGKMHAREVLLKKLGMTEKSVQADVEHLMDWMNKQQHFPVTDHIDLNEWLLNQLIVGKNSLERTKTNIERYFAVRSLAPDFFQGRDILENNISQTYENLSISYLPGLTPRHQIVSILRFESSDPETFDSSATAKRCIMAMEYFLKEGIYFSGFHVVLDLENIRLGHLARFSVSMLRSMSVAMKAYPISFGTINILNCPSFIEKAMAIFRPFVSPKLMGRIVIVKSNEELKKLIGDVELPVNYSGAYPLTNKQNSDLMKDKFLSIREYILKCDQARCDDSKRTIPSVISVVSEPEIEGSFRKLSID